MRVRSLPLRILILAVLLPIVAGVCVFALVVTGGLNPHITQMVAVGIAVLILATLAAAISAFTPKYRPTPLLTPLFAGIIASVVATTAIYAIRVYVTPRHAAVAAVEPKPATPAPPPAVETPPVAPARMVVPEAPAQQPAMQPNGDTAANAPAQQPAMQPNGDTAANASAQTAKDQVPAGVQLLPGNAADRAAMGGPLVDMANAVVPPAKAAEQSAAATDQQKPTNAMARIPIPTAAPKQAPNPDAPLDLIAGVEPAAPTELTAPMVLDSPQAAPVHHAATPPLPRIRPCGGAGPACP